MMLGGVLAYNLGVVFDDWRYSAFTLAVVPLLGSFTMLWFPETPYWLIENNDYNGARISLQFFRGKEYCKIIEELDEIKEKHQSKLQDAQSLSWKFQIKRIFSMAFLKPFSCVGVLYSLTTWTGFDILQTYMINVLDESGSSIWINLSLVPTIAGMIGLITAGIESIILDSIC